MSTPRTTPPEKLPGRSCADSQRGTGSTPAQGSKSKITSKSYLLGQSLELADFLRALGDEHRESDLLLASLHIPCDGIGPWDTRALYGILGRSAESRAYRRLEHVRDGQIAHRYAGSPRTTQVSDLVGLWDGSTVVSTQALLWNSVTGDEEWTVISERARDVSGDYTPRVYYQRAIRHLLNGKRTDQVIGLLEALETYTAVTRADQEIAVAQGAAQRAKVRAIEGLSAGERERRNVAKKDKRRNARRSAAQAKERAQNSAQRLALFQAQVTPPKTPQSIVESFEQYQNSLPIWQSAGRSGGYFVASLAEMS